MLQLIFIMEDLFLFLKLHLALPNIICFMLITQSYFSLQPNAIKT